MTSARPRAHARTAGPPDDAASAVTREGYPPLRGDLELDVAVVGAGIAGVEDRAADTSAP